jgi:hypothetical protein
MIFHRVFFCLNAAQSLLPRFSQEALRFSGLCLVLASQRLERDTGVDNHFFGESRPWVLLQKPCHALRSH